MNNINRLAVLCLVATFFASTPDASPGTAPEIERGWADPPRDARLRAYWWWLNGNVTREAITRDLEEMKAKGWGGALLCDAGGAAQDGNDEVRHGPTFLSPEWRALFRHALGEAARLDLELSLNIQSGWNLGGPMVSAADAAKKLVWSETIVRGPARVVERLPQPAALDGYYRDAHVVAYRLEPADIAGARFAGFKACSEQPARSLDALGDGDPATFWVSTTGKLRVGPSCERPAWVQFEFLLPTTIDTLRVTPRPGYGPRECELKVSDDGTTFRSVKAFTADERKESAIRFAPVTGRVFRLAIFGAFDPRSPQAPRNVQIAELRLAGPDGLWPDPTRKERGRPLAHWEEKAGHKPLHFSAPDTTPLLVELPAEAGEEDARAGGVVDLGACVEPDGRLRWDAPAGTWRIFRFGMTVGNRSHVSTSSEGWTGFALDVLDAGALNRYWDAVVDPLLADAGPLAGRVLKYLHTDSWELEPINWTPTLTVEFRKRRGYDPVPFLPVLAGRIIENRESSHRFLHDFRRTLGDLAIDNHYRILRERAHACGLRIHPESGGPHAIPVDAQQCLGFNDVPMSEFWAWSWRHRIGDENRFFVKQPASAAHVYGRRLVAAEGFTTIGPHWQETLWDNLKPAFDKACCEGLNLLFWHAFVCSPAAEGMPGIQYFAGTHLNPNTTWWSRSAPFIAWINRCQFMLQQGLVVADVCHYYGDHVPNFARLKSSDPAGALPGHDYDVITEEALLTRACARDGRIVLPDGMSYRLLTLREHDAISLRVLRRIEQLVAGGVTVLGPKPARATGLENHPACDAEVRAIADRLWDGDGSGGRVRRGAPACEVLSTLGVQPDFEWAGGDRQTSIDFIHRRTDAADIYFVASRAPRPEHVRCTFRVAGRRPELWDPVTGLRRAASAFEVKDRRTVVPLEFPPCGSFFVVFRSPTDAPPTGTTNSPSHKTLGRVEGPWTVAFDPAWGGPASARFDRLVSWTDRAEPGIRHYSGTATYRAAFDLPAGAARLGPGARLFLDLGQVRELAEIRLNGRALGIVWAPPFRVEISGVAKPTGNDIEIDVVNFWPNRIIGDASRPPERRLTRTNIRKLTADTALMPSGLLGPVTITSAE